MVVHKTASPYLGGLGIQEQHQLYSESLSPCNYGITWDHVSNYQQNNQTKPNKQTKTKKKKTFKQYNINTNVIIKVSYFI